MNVVAFPYRGVVVCDDGTYLVDPEKFLSLMPEFAHGQTPEGTVEAVNAVLAEMYCPDRRRTVIVRPSLN